MSNSTASPQLHEYTRTRSRLVGAGATLATIVENANVDDPQVKRALDIYRDANDAHEAAFDALMEKERLADRGAPR